MAPPEGRAFRQPGTRQALNLAYHFLDVAERPRRDRIRLLDGAAAAGTMTHLEDGVFQEYEKLGFEQKLGRERRTAAEENEAAALFGLWGPW